MGDESLKQQSLASVSLRLATPDDVGFLRSLHRLAYEDVVTRQFGRWDECAQMGWFEKGLRDACFYIVEHEGVAVGAVGLVQAADQLMIAELQVLPDWRGQGIGSQLLRTQIDSAMSRDVPVTLRCLKQNNRARRLYERHGFVVLEETEHHVLMERSHPRPSCG